MTDNDLEGLEKRLNTIAGYITLSPDDSEALMEAAEALSRLRAERALDREALEPFAKAGLLIDRYFPDNPDTEPYHGGAAWREGGQTRAVTLGDFRRASLRLQPEGEKG